MFVDSAVSIGPAKSWIQVQRVEAVFYRALLNFLGSVHVGVKYSTLLPHVNLADSMSTHNNFATQTFYILGILLEALD